MPNVVADSLAADRQQLLARAGAIVSRCRAQGNRDLSAAEAAEFDRLHAAAESLVGQIRVVGDRPARGAARPPAVRQRDTPEYAAAFASYLATGAVDAALQTDISDSGGYLAPPQFVSELVKSLDSGSWFRSKARVLPPTTAPSVVRPSRTARMNAAAWSVEVAPPTPDAAFRAGQFTLSPHYMSGEVEVATTLAEAGGVEAVVRGEIAAAAGELEEQAYMTGTGAGQPVGLFTLAAPGGGLDATRDATGDPTSYDFWFGALMSLDARYLRAGGLSLVCHPNAFRALSLLKTSDGDPVLKPVQALPGRFAFGPALVELSGYAPAGTGPNGTYASGDYVAAFGDLSRYAIQDGTDFGVRRLVDSYYARRGLAGYLFRRKVDGQVWDPLGFVRLKKA